MEASIVIVGDEILAGHVQDANAFFIAGRLAEHGHFLRRSVTVSDDPADIAVAVRAGLDDPLVTMIFVCGGLGPTHDDRTMEGVAAALSVPLTECAPIAARISRIAQRLAGSVAGEALGLAGLAKMAMAPEGAEALEGPSGVLPAVTISTSHARLIVLPGPPRELATVFGECVEPRYLAGTGAAIVRAEIDHAFPESALAAALAATEAAVPGVKIGSYPLPDRVLIRIAGPSAAVEAAQQSIQAAIKELETSEDGATLLQMMRTHRDREGQ